ncbi:MAG: SDR family oxidoreductase [Oscillochloris sp.]|nr:SDR family oxidoreductase [Oscillochloris sp.]
MQISVFGASGRTGRPLIEQALAQGHQIVGLVRDPAKLPIQHERLQVVQGDISDPQAVDQAIAGSEAVISVIGHVKHSPADLQAVATRNIIAAMRRHNVRRLVSLTGAGVRAPQDQPKLFDHVIRFALKTMAGDVLRDAIAHAELIQSSDLDWVIVRGPMLTDGPRAGNYRVGWVGVNTSPRITRADLADFLLTQATDQRYIRKMPMVSA